MGPRRNRDFTFRHGQRRNGTALAMPEYLHEVRDLAEDNVDVSKSHKAMFQTSGSGALKRVTRPLSAEDKRFRRASPQQLAAGVATSARGSSGVPSTAVESPASFRRSR